jgi:hypothetical protein
MQWWWWWQKTKRKRRLPVQLPEQEADELPVSAIDGARRQVLVSQWWPVVPMVQLDLANDAEVHLAAYEPVES